MLGILMLPLMILLGDACKNTPLEASAFDTGGIAGKASKPKTVKGLSLVAPPNPFPENPMPAIQAVNSDWIAVIPYGFTRVSKPDVGYNFDRQWWGERADGVAETVRLAHASGIKVMLKPQLWIPRSWTGDLYFPKEEDQVKWEAAYDDFILFYAELADSLDVEMFCVGTEFKKMEVTREAFWRSTIKKVKEVYPGKLTYAANWDCYDKVPFWDAVDYIGIDAYFPLDDSKTPTKKSLIKDWQPVIKNIRAVHEKFDRPVLFTEFGYMSVDGAAGKTWELEAKRNELKPNDKAQAIALDALFSAFAPLDFWEGGFLWKWYPSEGWYKDHPTNDYTPQGKVSEETVKDWYGKM